ncbi:MAG TPA: hypothetical protein VNV85_02450, partial [Puia sp.]|nr:hypothetical protein [Puia sp.]
TFMRRINITFLGKGLLTIDNWISKAKTGAVAGTIKKKADTDIFDAQVLANKLYKKYIGYRERIHTMANAKLGGQEYARIIADLANKPSIDRELHLCYILADQFPLEMKGELMA